MLIIENDKEIDFISEQEKMEQYRWSNTDYMNLYFKVIKSCVLS